MSLRSAVAVPDGSVTAPIRVGLVGAGGIAAAHFAGYAQHSDTVVLRAVCERDPDLRARRSVEWGVPSFADLDHMLAQAEIDAVDICLPHDQHVDAVLAAVRAGKHVLCEKPLAMSVADVERIARTADEAGVTVMCAHNQLFRPDVQAVARLLDDGSLGRVYDIDITGLYRPEFDPKTIGWRGKMESSGGGELLDSGFHAVYVLLRLMSATPSAVTAVLARHRLDFLPAEDTAYLTVEFAGGGVGTIRSTWAYDPAGAGETIAVHGELGSLRADARQVEIRRIGEEPVVTALPVGGPLDTYVSEVELFGRVLRAGTGSLPGPDDARITLEVILGAYRSAEERRAVPLVASA